LASDTPTLVAVIVVVILVPYFWIIGLRQRKAWSSVDAAWKALADELGLNLELSKLVGVRNMYSPKVSGKYRDHLMVLDTYRVSRRYTFIPHSVFYTSLVVQLNRPAKDTMIVHPAGHFARGGFHGKTTPYQTIQTGDPAFDRKLTVKGSNEPVVRKVLDSSIRQQLMEIVQERFKIGIEESKAYYEEQSGASYWAGTPDRGLADSARLRRVLDFVVDLAIRFEEQMG